MPLAVSKLNYFMQRAADPAFPNSSAHAGQLTLVFRIRHKTTLTLYHEHRLILMPQRFAQTTESRTNLYYTKGSIVADTPTPHGVGITIFQISGHTGFAGVVDETPGPTARVSPAAFVETAQQVAQTVQNVFHLGALGAARSPRQSHVDGAAAIKDFQETFLRYFDPGGDASVEGVTQTSDLQLEFLNLTAPRSGTDPTGQIGWIIHPHRNLVDIQQDASKPFLYQYNFQFAGIQPIDVPLPDVFVERYTTPRTGLQAALDQLTAMVTTLTNGVNTLEDAMTQMVIQNVTGPVSTFLLGCAQLGDAVANFMESAAAKIQFPLYAQRTAAHVLDAPRHSVTTLAMAAHDLGLFLISAALPQSLGRLLAGHEIIPGVNDVLTLSLNDEAPQTLTLPALTDGPAIATAIQSQVRALTPQHAANVSAYRDFTAVYDVAQQQYQLTSGTHGHDRARVHVQVPRDPELSPGDASASLGLGLANGGQEHVGSAYPNPALALLRGVEAACVHLQAFPDYFADQLDAQDAALVARLPVDTVRSPLRGTQRLHQQRITPGDSLQGIAARVGVPWETLALVNRLTYPYILEQPGTLTQGRVSSATFWQMTDALQSWPVNGFQGQRLDIVHGPGAGQSRQILHNTATELFLATDWTIVPTDTSDYAIRQADNPIVATSAVTSCLARTLTDSTLAVVPDAHRGLQVRISRGPSAGETRRIVTHDQTTYLLDRPWDVIPPPGSPYLLLGPAPATARQRLVGDLLSVPRPSAQALTPIRSRLYDASAITGRQITTEEQLFGRDLLLDGRTLALVYDPGTGDAHSIAGLANLRQALIHYINLPLSELEYAPGLGSFVQETLGLFATLPLQQEVLASVHRTIRQDLRIARLGEARLLTQGGTTLIALTAIAIDGSSVDRVVVR